MSTPSEKRKNLSTAASGSASRASPFLSLHNKRETMPHSFKSRGKIDPNEVVGIVQDAGSPNVSETDGELLTMW